MRLLENLHTTDLPLDHLQLLRLIAHFGLPPSGARSRQQFAYYLLSYMCDRMKFPPWDPQPVISIVAPDHQQLCDRVGPFMEERVTGLEDRPHAYIHRPNNQVAKTWQSRRQAWPIFMKTLGDPKSGLGKCTHQLVSAHVSVMNLVLAHSPKSGITDLRCEMDDAQHTVDRKQAWKFFVPAWNEVVSSLPRAPTITSFKRCEWKWILGWLKQACKRAVAQGVRVQFDESDAQDKLYVGDKGDGRHAYYCVGAIWRAVLKYFWKYARICCVIHKMFLDVNAASKLGLPTEEVSARYSLSPSPSLKPR